MEVYCPDCSTKIDPDSINIQTNLAKCHSCGSISKLNEIIDSLETRPDSNGKPELPAGSRITIQNAGESSIEFLLPPVGFKSKSIPFLIFSAVWLGFITIWTTLALQASLAFAAFSIPFWLVGFGMLTLAVNIAREKQLIHLDREFLTIQKLRPVKSKEVKIRIDEIDSIGLEYFRTSGMNNIRVNRSRYNSNNCIPSLVPVISYGVNKESFFENSSEAEHKWIVGTLNIIIRKLKKNNYFTDFYSLV